MLYNEVLKTLQNWGSNVIGGAILVGVLARFVNFISHMIQTLLFDMKFYLGDTWILIGSILFSIASITFALTKYKVCPMRYKFMVVGMVLFSILIISNGICRYCNVYGHPDDNNSGFVVRLGLFDKEAAFIWRDFESASLFVSHIAESTGKHTTRTDVYINYIINLNNGNILEFRNIFELEMVYSLLVEHNVKIAIIPKGFDEEETIIKNSIKKYRKMFNSNDAIFHEYIRIE